MLGAYTEHDSSPPKTRLHRSVSLAATFDLVPTLAAMLDLAPTLASDEGTPRSATSTIDTNTVAFSVNHVDVETHDAVMITMTVDYDEYDGVGEAMRRYNDMLAAIGFGPDHHTDDVGGDGTAYYNARAEITTNGKNADATPFEPATHEEPTPRTKWHRC